MSSQGGLDLKNDDFFQNLFLEVIKLEIEETKGKLPISVFKSVYWGPFLGLYLHRLVKTSRPFPRAILCPRPFCEISTVDLTVTTLDKSKPVILQNVCGILTKHQL